MALKKAGLRPVAFDPYLGPRGARFTTYEEPIGLDGVAAGLVVVARKEA